MSAPPSPPTPRPARTRDQARCADARPGTGRRPPSIGFITPISPTTPGNGLAHRARGWQRAIDQIGTLTTVVVPTHGPPCGDADEVVPLVRPAPDEPAPILRGSHAPEWHGRRWATGRAPFDAIVVLGADLAAFALGVAAAMPRCRVIVDLDDDLEQFHRSRGDDATASRYAALVDDARRRADLVCSVTGFDGTEAIPNAVDVPLPAPGAAPLCRDRSSGAPTVIIVGNQGYPPNAEGVRWFTDHAWPRVRAARPDARLVVAGPGSASLPHGVGFVEDLGELYRSASVAVVPLLHGSGSRIKALEAFAHGVPVVGTTVGLDGLDVEHDRHCLLADDAAGLAAAILRVLEDPDVAGPLALRAHRRVLGRYERAEVTRRTAELIEQVLGSTRTVTHVRPAHLRTRATGEELVVADPATGSEHRLPPPVAAVFLLASNGVHPDDIARSAAGSAPLGSVRVTVDQALERLCALGLLHVVPMRDLP